MNTNEHEFDRLIEQVVGAAYEMSNVLGVGFLEKVYERALALEVRSCGLTCETHVSLPVAYKGVRIGEYVADLIAEERLVVEVKCADRLAK
jgi:GxxExxY protein